MTATAVRVTAPDRAVGTSRSERFGELALRLGRPPRAGQHQGRKVAERDVLTWQQVEAEFAASRPAPEPPA
jgi:hypothetical protein